ncbi:hypothetical protein [Streptomyces anulatus]|uniref:hypothetical protein n=1 Tax=Streptomyces anulatus TaxID=1892 RepID=UPI0034139D4B
MAETSTDEFAQAAADLAISRLGEKYDLVYINQGDHLSEEQLHRLFAEDENASGLDHAEDVLDLGWLDENRYHGTQHVLGELLDDDAQEFLEKHDVLDQVRHAIEERDQSDPIGDLMNGTGPQLFRYRLDGEAEADPWRFSDAKSEEVARALATAAGIDFWDNVGALQELVAHSSYGGGLHILWRGDVRAVWDAVNKIRGALPDAEPTITAQWTDPELLVLDTWNGSGHTVKVRGTVRLPFEPARLSLDTIRAPGGYSWTNVVGGGYQPEGDEPQFIETHIEEAQHG